MGAVDLAYPSTSPSYYSRWKIEPLEFCIANDLPFWLGNIIKYGMRYDQKDGLADLKKARVYLDTKIKQLEGEMTIYDKHRASRAEQPR